MSMDELVPVATPSEAAGGSLDVERDSDVPISTQIYWQLAYQIESGRLQPGTRLPPVRELGAVLRVNPNTVRAVYRRLADAGYVIGRHGAGTRVVDRPPVRRGSDALAGIVAETLRRAAQQLKLQQAVEGLSVVAISYYMIGLLGYAGKAAKAAGLPVNPDIATGVLVPLVLGAVWLGLRRVHRRMHKV